MIESLENNVEQNKTRGKTEHEPANSVTGSLIVWYFVRSAQGLPLAWIQSQLCYLRELVASVI